MPGEVTRSDRLLTVSDVAEMLACSVANVWRAVADGRLPQPFYVAPKAPRWSAEELRAALEATRQRPGDAMAARRSARLAAKVA
jgi:predicted DNA-binding transcriptional regulator AlpA